MLSSDGKSCITVVIAAIGRTGRHKGRPDKRIKKGCVVYDTFVISSL